MSEDLPLEIERLIRQTQFNIMSDIIRRIKINSEITRSADWQFDRLSQLGESKDFVKKEIQKVLKLTDADIQKLFEQAAESGYSHNKSLYKAVGKDYIPYSENQWLQQLVTAAVTQTNGEMRNITQSLGFVVKQGNKLIFSHTAKYYQTTLDQAVSDIASGAFDYNTVIKRVVAEMTNSGLRTVDYSSGHSNRVDVAVRRAVMTGLNQLTGKIQENNAAELATDKYEVTWHATARPEHQPWQGRVYTYDELVSVCGLGKVDGLKGANCRHDYFPFIEGVSERVYTDAQLDEMNAKENEKRSYNGKEYTAYEATQRQRRLETAMRAQRQKIKLLKQAGADENDIITARCKYRSLSAEYTDFCDKMNLPQERQRVYSDGLGNIGTGRTKSVANSENSGIMNTGDVEMFRKSKIGKAEPMPKKQFLKIEKRFKARGGVFQYSNETDEYLKKRNAEAITYNSKTILFRKDPSRASVFEELIHATQYKNGENDGSYISRLKCEIAAQKKLIKYSKAYNLTELEIRQTQEALQAYENELNNYNNKKGGNENV